MGRSTPLRAAALLAASTLLSACGGGGGGQNGPSLASPLAPAPATSKTGAILHQGLGRDFTVVEGEKGEDARASGYSAAEAASLQRIRDAEGAVSELTLSAAGLSTSWSKADRQLNQEDGLLVGLKSLAGEDGASRAVAVIASAPETAGFAHQSFGLWYDLNPSALTSRFGAVAGGERTSAVDLPKSGQAVFVGSAAGMRTALEEGEMTFKIVRAEARVEADFAGRSANFSTSGSSTGRDAAGLILDPSLDLSGALRMTADGGLSGKVSTKGGLSGELDARFHGPGAAEVGGIFALQGEGAESFIGGFGAARK